MYVRIKEKHFRGRLLPQKLRWSTPRKERIVKQGGKTKMGD